METAVIDYRQGNDLNIEAVCDLYIASTLGARRPVDDRERMARMIREANLVVTAWEGDLLVGIARAMSDFAFVTYLADLAVRESHQRRGIGKQLIEQVRTATPQATLVLLSAPDAVDYYPHIGMTRHSSAWYAGAEDVLH